MKKVLYSIYLISLMSLKEVIKKRIVFVVLMISSLFLVLNLYCESAVIQTGGEELKDSNIGSTFIFLMISFWNMMLSILITSAMISDEMENRAYVMILSKPIYRLSYFAGKFGGVFILCSLNAISIASIYTTILYFKKGIWNFEIFLGLMNLLPSSLLLILTVGFFAILINRTSSLMISFFLITSSLFINFPIYEFQESTLTKIFAGDGFKQYILNSLYWFLPQFGTSFFYSFSFVAKSFAQTHYLGIYSLIQVSVWFVLLWILLYFLVRNKELG